MKILSLTAGAANMYCGSCLRDNALAAELRRLGHQVTLVPVYTPTKTDEHNESSAGRILFGGISVYLQQHSAIFRHTPWLLDRLWDSRWALSAAAKRSIAVDPKSLGELTVSMLEGEEGPLRKEFEKLAAWMDHLDPHDVVNIPNSMLIAMAGTIRKHTPAPIVCTLQGEDLFLDGLIEPYRSRAADLIRSQTGQVDVFLSISDAYADHMSVYLDIDREKVRSVPVGVRVEDFAGDAARFRDRDGVFRVGYLARIAPEKGLHTLVEAYSAFKQRWQGESRLDIAGYLGPEHEGYLHSVLRQAETWGIGGEVHYRGEMERRDKIDFLASLEAFCVPAVYDDPKALYALEAMASGVPVIAPARGAMMEHVTACEGGLLVMPDSPGAIADALAELAGNPLRSRALGAAGRLGVEEKRSVNAMARRTLAVYHSLVNPSAHPAIA
jgi:glycosyltransferase involved in cell wall biosynthesis